MRKDISNKGKKILIGALALSMTLSTTAWAGLNRVFDDSTEPARSLVGDVNGDNDVSLDDAQIVLRMALRIITDATDEQKRAADANKDNDITLDDAQKVLRMALRIEPLETLEPLVTETPEPSATPTSAVTEPVSTPTATPKITPPPATVGPTITPKPIPTGKALPTVEAADYVVTADAVEMIASNGAVEVNGVYTFTDANATNKKGIQFSWPYAERTDLRQTATEAGVTLIDIADVSRANKASEKQYDPEYSYPRPEWTNGISISFWSKEEWDDDAQTNTDPLLVLKSTKYCDSGVYTGLGSAVNSHGEGCDFAFMLRSNGSVVLESGDEAKNSFTAQNYIAGKNNQWNYYTVTFANDWITVYINGQELAYQNVFLSKDDGAKCFNDGFMTRYNPIGKITQQMLDDDIRGYLSAKGNKKGAWYLLDGKEDKPENYDTNIEATLIGNSIYANPGAVRGKKLLVDLLTQDSVELWIGATKTCCIDSPRVGYVTYATPTGSQVSSIECYTSELKADEVAAIYENALTRDAGKLGLE